MSAAESYAVDTTSALPHAFIWGLVAGESDLMHVLPALHRPGPS